MLRLGVEINKFWWGGGGFSLVVQCGEAGDGYGGVGGLLRCVALRPGGISRIVQRGTLTFLGTPGIINSMFAERYSTAR